MRLYCIRNVQAVPDISKSEMLVLLQFSRPTLPLVLCRRLNKLGNGFLARNLNKITQCYHAVP